MGPQMVRGSAGGLRRGAARQHRTSYGAPFDAACVQIGTTPTCWAGGEHEAPLAEGWVAGGRATPTPRGAGRRVCSEVGRRSGKR